MNPGVSMAPRARHTKIPELLIWQMQPQTILAYKATFGPKGRTTLASLGPRI